MARRPLLTDDEILARVRPVFVEKGFAARTQQLARAAGLTWGALALRFGDKRSLFDRAMSGPVPTWMASSVEADGHADLATVLERLRAFLWTWWPRRLQVRLAGSETDAAQGLQEPLRRLVAALEAAMQEGAVRSDQDAGALARLILTALIGDVAQRFVTRDPSGAPDPVLVDGLVRLVSVV